MYHNESNEALISSDSSIISDNCIEDISSIQNLSMHEDFKSPWSFSPGFNPTERFTPQPIRSTEIFNLYQENQALKKKIRDLQSSLNKDSKPKPNQHFLTDQKPTSWFSRKSVQDSSSENSVVRNLQTEFSAENLQNKRDRQFESDKQPHKFLKLAMVKSIGTLKF
jgi:hypothetical protein